MTIRWPEYQVTALAPDTGSLTAARGLTGTWTDTGWCGHTLWGSYRGSGRTPYRTLVDLSRPEFRCSCPSRKSPCKHALSLLLRWSAGRVPEADAPADSTEWTGQRPAPGADRRRSRGPGAAAIQRRHERVTAGAAELGTWLTDRIRTGLARTDHSPATFEAVAARMIDAQAPGIAAELRRLPAALDRTDWPDVLLGRFARLHLLLTAYARLETLPPTTAATVRTRIGFPTPADTVRAEPPVHDRWIALGRRIDTADRLHTRRTWLFGVRTRRWALLIDRVHGTPDFPTEAPPVGSIAPGGLHFYPAAAPLRALLDTTATPTSDAGAAAAVSGSIAGALEAFATAAAADPWVESWPVLVRTVVPTGRPGAWLLAEPDGTAIPLVEPADPWRLPALSGGRPITVFGLWTGRALEAVSVLVAGAVHDAGPVADPAHTTVTATAEAASIALLGTARGATTLPPLPEPVRAAVDALPETDPAHRLLAATALEIAWSRGGYLPVRADLPMELAAADPRPVLPAAAAARLEELIESRPEYLPEWFAAAAPHDFRAPDILAAPLIDLAARHDELREATLRLAGARGRWLAARMPHRHGLVRHDPAAPEASADTWHLGSPPERVRWLAGLRRRDPTAARDTLAHAWPRESGAVKADLLAVLADGLGPADEPLLEGALDDRRGDVRRTAAALLARLPDSAFAVRMAHRAKTWVTHTAAESGHAAELVVEIPESLDASDVRDGFPEHATESGYRWDGRPDPLAARLRRLVSLLPLDRWAAPAQAGRIVASGIADRFREPLFDGWMDAALARRDPVWAAALFAAGTPSNAAILRRRELFALIPAADQARHLVRLDASWLSELESLLPAVAQPWPPEIARHLLHLLAERARTAERRPGAPGSRPTAYRSLLHTAACHLPPAWATATETVARRCTDTEWARALDALAHELHLRSAMLEELQ